MKLNILKNAKQNMLWGVGLKIYQILVPLFIRNIFISRLGIEYSGLGELFSSVLNFLSLVEMGAGSAVLFFLYKPIAEDDIETVRRLLGLIHRLYRWIGLTILIVGLTLIPFIRFLISGDIPDGINIYVIYIMNLFSVVLSYWLFAYKRIILSVHQRNDILSRINIAASTFQYIAQIAVLLLAGSYYAYLTVVIAAKLLEKLVTVIVVDKKYPMCKPLLEPLPQMKAELGKKMKALILHRIGGVIVSSADTIVISATLGLALLGKYQNYYYIMTSVLGFVMLINTSIQAGIGNQIAAGSIAETRKFFERYVFLFFIVCTVCCCCFLNLYQPFITLWLGKDMLLDDGLVVIFCIYFYANLLMIPGNAFESAGGIWQHDRWRPFIEGILNLGINILLVHYIGLYGILLSTIFSMVFFSVPWLYYIVTKQLLGGSFREWFMTLLQNTVSAAIICFTSYLTCRLLPAGLPLLVNFLFRGILSVGISVTLLYLFYRKNPKWNWLCETIHNIL